MGGRSRAASVAAGGGGPALDPATVVSALVCRGGGGVVCLCLCVCVSCDGLLVVAVVACAVLFVSLFCVSGELGVLRVLAPNIG